MAPERAFADAELFGDRCCLHLAGGKRADKVVFDDAPEPGRAAPFREQVVGVGFQDLQQMRVG